MFDPRKARFDLERSFAEWRWQMLATGIKAPVPLEELEIHLREDVEVHMRLEPDAERAFEAAVRRMGHASEIMSEFNKTCRTRWSARLWWVFSWIGSFGLVQTMMLNFVGPLVFHRHASAFLSQKWWADWFPSYIVWISLMLVGLAIGFANWKSQRKAVRL